jgi:hypothetical protein
MNKLILCVLYFIFFSNSAYTFEGGFVVAKIYNIEVKNEKLGIALDIDKTSKGRVLEDVIKYAIYTDGKIELISKKDYGNEFSQELNSENMEKNIFPEKVKDSDGNAYNIRYLNCKDQSEGERLCNRAIIEVDHTDIDINLLADNISKVGCRITTVERIGNLLLFSCTLRGEFNYRGNGVSVLDITAKKIIKNLYLKRSIAVASDNAKPLATVIKKIKDILWVGGSYGIYGYDTNLNLIHACNLLVSYLDVDKNGKEILKDRFEFYCDK